MRKSKLLFIGVCVPLLLFCNGIARGEDTIGANIGGTYHTLLGSGIEASFSLGSDGDDAALTIEGGYYNGFFGIGEKEEIDSAITLDILLGHAGGPLNPYFGIGLTQIESPGTDGTTVNGQMTVGCEWVDKRTGLFLDFRWGYYPLNAGETTPDYLDLVGSFFGKVAIGWTFN